ncbi:oligopeptide/dipeptide ABC transporter ATP-binding protein [Ferrovibrio sp.]|uniref:ABC transporter ATP-binding protein n=1 Tax=Ferrovibrio sp. TaxID=1917215 RepID=UPI001B6B1FA9|nr:oligopeptide/dipeptide ABC transporter ATP-binding protein [Ferrovibrio sp.]MBP7064702.1 ATP-binding cassette domain-containing protein [Ferrovibrio sp.]
MTLLRIEQVHRSYRLPGQGWFGPARQVLAVQGVSLDLAAGESLGLVGESGSGKSTLARLAMALEQPSQGRVLFQGQDLNALDAAALRAARRDFQMVFQDPYGSLDPRQRVGRIVAEPLEALERADRAERVARVAEALDMVGLRAGDAEKYPHEFSGGQRQRIAIARALITRPKLIVADEPVSALDVSVQASVLNLMQGLQRQFGITYLFISHNLAVVDHLCARVAVMYLGRIVEQGDTATIFQAPAHPYTRALLAALPKPQPPPAGTRRKRHLLQGNPGLASAEPGCALAERCAFVQQRCRSETPALREHSGRQVACHRAGEI